MIAKKPTVVLFLNIAHPKKSGECAVYLRVTHNRKVKYYPTTKSLTPAAFEKVLTQKPGKLLYETSVFLQEAKADVQRIIDSIPVFTFEKFNEKYNDQQPKNDTVECYFDNIIDKLKSSNRLGTASSYSCARVSLLSYKPGLKLVEVTVSFLHGYQSWMLEKGNSRTTVGIYLRALRVVMNQAKENSIIEQSDYPFGKYKFKIHKGNNIKKALTIEDIAKIFNYEVEPGTTKERAKNYFLAMYFLNGCNMVDMARLKYSDIDGDFISYERTKTINSAEESRKIVISMPPQLKSIIEKFGNKNKAGYIFPILTKGLSAERQRQLIQQIVSVVNKYMKQIGKDLGFEKPLTTYTSRHSYADILQKSGIPIEQISQALGHQNTSTTRSYLAQFDRQSKVNLSNIISNF